MRTATKIPLFPLGVVLLPGMKLPLHIFEERYKTMIAECRADNKEFGIVYFKGNDISHAGCTAQIIEVLKSYDTGEMDIMILGKSRFRIKKIYDSAPYLEAEVVYFDDELQAKTARLADLAEEGLIYLQELDNLSGEPSDIGKAQGLSPKQISFLIAQNEGFALQERQKFLEITSTKKRLEAAAKTLQMVVQRTKLTLKIQHVIGGNGNLDKILKNYGA